MWVELWESKYPVYLIEYVFRQMVFKLLCVLMNLLGSQPYLVYEVCLPQAMGPYQRCSPVDAGPGNSKFLTALQNETLRAQAVGESANLASPEPEVRCEVSNVSASRLSSLNAAFSVSSISIFTC